MLADCHDMDGVIIREDNSNKLTGCRGPPPPAYINPRGTTRYIPAREREVVKRCAENYQHL